MPGFIHLTDTHIVAPGALAYSRSDTASALRLAIDTVNARLPMLGDVTCALVTGDLTDHGTPEQYAHFTELAARLDLPILAVPGNHDRREPMRDAFRGHGWMPPAGPIQWYHDFGDFALIGLDTLLEGAHHGMLSEDGFAFLDATLGNLGDRPVVIATHHPWIASGIPAMDADNLHNGARLMARLAAHPGAVRMISGHVHRAVTGQVGGITCQIAPATCHAVATDHRPGREAHLALEPGAVTLCHWPGGAAPGLLTDIIPLGTFSGPWPFED